MMPFKDADKHAKVFLEKFMDIVALFLMPLSYITFKALACMIDFMFAMYMTFISQCMDLCKTSGPW